MEVLLAVCCVAGLQARLRYADDAYYDRGHHVASSGGFAYVGATSSGVLVFDINNAAAPVRVGTCEVNAVDVLLVGSLLYVAGANGLAVCDVTDPTAPTVISTLCPATGCFCEDLDVSGITLYLGAGTGRLMYTVDVTDPTSPTLLGTYAAGDNVQDVYVSGMYVYVATYTWLEIVDVADLANPTQAGSYGTTGAGCIVISGTTAYVGTENSELAVLDVTNPVAPVLLGAVSVWRSHVHFVLDGTTVYAARWSEGVDIFDVATPSSPALLANYPTPGVVGGLVKVGTTVFAAGYWGFLFYALDVSTPTSPSLLTQYGRTDSSPSYAEGTVAVVIESNYYDIVDNIRIYDVSVPTVPVELSTMKLTKPAEIPFIVGTLLYVATEDGLGIVDIADPSMPALLGDTNIGGFGGNNALSIWVEGAAAYVALGSGLYTFDVSDPTAPVMVNTTSDQPPLDVTVEGTTAYTCTYNGLVLSDVTTPASSTYLSQYSCPSGYSVSVSRQTAYLVCLDGLHIIDVSNPAAPSLIFTMPIAGGRKVHVSGQTAYIAAYYSLRVFDVFDPTAPIEHDSVPTASSAKGGISTVGNMVYTSPGGLMILEISPATPTLTLTASVTETMTLPTLTPTATSTLSSTPSPTPSATSVITATETLPVPPTPTGTSIPVAGTATETLNSVTTATVVATPQPVGTPIQLDGPSATELADFSAARVRLGAATLTLGLAGAVFHEGAAMSVVVGTGGGGTGVVVRLGDGGEEGLTATFARNESYITHATSLVTSGGKQQSMLTVHFREQDFHTTLREVVTVEVADGAFEGAAAYCATEACSFEALVVPDLPPSYAEAQATREVAGTVSAGVAALGGSPGGAAKIGALSLTARAALCPGDGPEQLDRTLNPFGISLGDGEYADYHGAVVGGLAVCGAVLLVCSAVAGLRIFLLRKRQGERGEQGGAPLRLTRNLFLRRGWFKLALMPLTFVYGGSALSMMTVWLYSHSGVANMVAATVLAVLVLGMPSYAVWAGRRCTVHASFVPVEEKQTMLRRVFWGSEEWVTREEGGEESEEWLAVHHLAFDGYKGGWKRYFFAIELGELLLLSGLAAWVPSTDTGCWERAGMMSVVVTAYVLLLVNACPYVAPYENVMEPMIAGVEAVMLYCTVAAMGSAGRPTEHVALKWSVMLSYVALWLVVTKSFIDFTVTGVDLWEVWTGRGAEEPTTEEPLIQGNPPVFESLTDCGLELEPLPPSESMICPLDPSCEAPPTVFISKNTRVVVRPL